jgi:predicted SprT family Zn-dependent metalloprotease
MEYKKPENELELIELFKSIARIEFHYECDIPIQINKKLYNSLGRTISIFEDGKYKCLGFDFNECYLEEDYTINELINTIKHELVHWYTDSKNNEWCHHDERFINNCIKFGVTDSTDFERYKPRKKLSKDQFYEAKCCNCNNTVAKCKNMNNLKKFMNWCDNNGGTVCSCGHSERYILDKSVKRIYNHRQLFTGEQYWLDNNFTKNLKIILCKYN